MSQLVELLVVKLPADMEEKIVEFHRFVLRARRRHDYQLSHILNMKENPMRFNLPATRTLEFTSRTVRDELLMLLLFPVA